MADDKTPLLSLPETVMLIHLDDEELETYQRAKADKSIEQTVHWTAPSQLAFLFRNWLIPVGMALLLIISLVLLLLVRNAFGRFLAGVLLILLAFAMAALEVRLWFRTYTRYIITPNRVLRMEGIVTKKVSAIQLLMISDVNSQVGPIGQVLNYGDIKIETANEGSKFGDLVEVPKPQPFLDWLNYARSTKERPKKATPLNDEMLRTIVNVGSMLTAGELVLERTETGGWRVRRDQTG